MSQTEKVNSGVACANLLFQQQQQPQLLDHDNSCCDTTIIMTTTTPETSGERYQSQTTHYPSSKVENDTMGRIPLAAYGSSVLDEEAVMTMLMNVSTTPSTVHSSSPLPLVQSNGGVSFSDGGSFSASSIVLDEAAGMLIGAIRLVVQQQQQQHKHLKQQRPHWIMTEYDEGMDNFTCFIEDIDQLVGDENSNISIRSICNNNKNIDVSTALMYNLGQALYRHNSLCGAMECFLHVIAMIHQHQQQQQHPLLIPALHNVGYVQYKKGNINDAIVTFQRALQLLMLAQQKRQKQVHGKDYNDYESGRITKEVALTHNCLGVLYFHRQQQQPAQPQTNNKALEHLKIAISIQRQQQQQSTQQSEFHDSVVDRRKMATTLNNIGRILYNQQRFEDAMEVYEEALVLRRLTLGHDHLDVAATVFNTGQTLQNLNRNEDALVCFGEFLRIARPRLGQSNQDVGYALKSMAEIYCCQQHDNDSHNDDNDNDNEQGTALALYADALVSFRASFGVQHPEVASIFNKMGNICYHRNDYETALDMYIQGLHVERAIFPPHHPNIIVTLSNIAQIYKQRDDHDLALSYYAQALAAQTTTNQAQSKSQSPSTTTMMIVGQSCADPSVAVTISNIAMIHYQKKNYPMSLQCHQEALRIRREIYGDFHLEVASSLNSIGLALFKLGIHETALETFQKSLKIRFNLLGEGHKDVAILLYNIATIQLELRNDDEALRMYRETLRLEKKTLGQDHLDLVSTLQCMAQVHQKNGEHHDAIFWYEDVCRIQRLHLLHGGIDAMTVARTLNNMANLHLQVGNVGKSVECMSEGSRIARSGPQRYECQNEEHNEHLHLVGFYLYGFARLHPEHAGAA